MQRLSKNGNCIIHVNVNKLPPRLTFYTRKCKLSPGENLAQVRNCILWQQETGTQSTSAQTHAQGATCKNLAQNRATTVSGLKGKKKLIAFGWYGGKFSHLEWLLPLLPPCHHYCEPFAGSAAVLLNRAPSPIETYNDLDGEVANFFRVLRNEKDRLIEMIGLTPFSREEFSIACTLDAELEPPRNEPVGFMFGRGRCARASRNEPALDAGQTAKTPVAPA